MTNIFNSLLSSVLSSASAQPPIIQGFLLGLFVFFVSLTFSAVIVAFRSVAGASVSK